MRILVHSFFFFFVVPSIAENCYFWPALAVAPRAVLARRGSCSHFAITQREIAAPNRISPHGKFDFLFRCLLRAIRQQQIGGGAGVWGDETETKAEATHADGEDVWHG